MNFIKNICFMAIFCVFVSSLSFAQETKILSKSEIQTLAKNDNPISIDNIVKLFTSNDAEAEKAMTALRSGLDYSGLISAGLSSTEATRIIATWNMIPDAKNQLINMNFNNFLLNLTTDPEKQLAFVKHAISAFTISNVSSFVDIIKENITDEDKYKAVSWDPTQLESNDPIARFVSTPMLGEIKIISFDTPPEGWLFCNGDLISIQSYPDLFKLIGTLYGGDGVTQFALPDLKAKVIMGQNEWSKLGQSGGNTHVTLDTISITAQYGTGTVYQPMEPNKILFAQDDNATAPHLLRIPKPGQHYNVQPYLTLNYIIAVKGI